MSKSGQFKAALLALLIVIVFALSGGPALARVSADGDLDPSFSSDGIVTTDFPATTRSFARTVLHQPDGKVLVGGEALALSQQQWLLARFNTDGSLDTTFGADGMVLSTFQMVPNSIDMLALQADGKILAFGKLDSYRALVRYQTNGAIDTSFGNNGVVLISSQTPNTFALQSSGKIILAGSSYSNGEYLVSVLRLLSDGTIDYTFGTDGEVRSDFSAGLGSASSLAVLADDRILFSSARTNENPSISSTALVRLLPDGALDTTFGTDGKVLTDYPSEYTVINSLVIQPDGKILAGLTGSGSFQLTRYSADGALDTGFGTGGTVATSFAEGTAYLRGSVVQSNNKIVVAGYTSSCGSDSCQSSLFMVRYNADGTVDGSFGDSGRVLVDLGVAGYSLYGKIIALDSEDKLVIIGAAGSTCNEQGCPSNAIGVARYTESGQLDTSFGVGGKAMAAYPISKAGATAIVRQTDGKFVVAGRAALRDPGLIGVALARYSSNGTLDTSFGISGRVVITTGVYASAEAMALQPDGKLVVAGASRAAGEDALQKFTLWRFTADGQLDSTFGDAGLVITTFGEIYSEQANAVLVLPGGKTVAAGNGGSVGFALARYNTDGSLDTSFGSDGKVTTPFSGIGAVATGLALATDGKLVAAGGRNGDLALARYNADGSLDSTFGIGGTVTQHINESSAFFNALVIQPDGKIVAAGQAVNGGIPRFAQVVVARYSIDGTLDTSFASDGITSFDLVAGYDTAEAIALQADGKIALAGAFDRTAGAALVRLTANGELDPTFGDYDTVFQYGIMSVRNNSRADALLIQPDGKWVTAGAAYDGVNSSFLLARINVDFVVAPPTSTASATASSTQTETATSTSTSTATATDTSTNTATATATRTATTTPSTATATATTPPSTATATATTPANTPTATAIPFSDVPSSAYFYEPVQYLAARGVISGYGDGARCPEGAPCFLPFNNATRGQMVKIIVLATGGSVITPLRQTFSDVPPSDPFYSFVETASALHIVGGYADGTFRPYANVTRGQLSKIVVVARAWSTVNPMVPSFVDVPTDNPFYQFVETAVEHGIISGYDLPNNGGREFRPGANATRGQISKIVFLAVTQ